MKVEQGVVGSEFDCRRIPEGGNKGGILQKAWASDGIHEAVKLCAIPAKPQYLKAQQKPGRIIPQVDEYSPGCKTPAGWIDRFVEPLATMGRQQTNHFSPLGDPSAGNLGSAKP